MLLRSSSTPVLGSLLPSFSESPSHNFNHHHHEAKPSTNLHHHSHSHATKLSIHQSGPLSHSTFSANSSPIDPDRYSSNKGFRRAQSDGNLAGLLAHDNASEDRLSRDSHFPNGNAFARRPRCLMLESIPSFSNYNSNGGFAEDSEEEESDFEDRFKSTNVTRDVKLKDEYQKMENGTATAAQGLLLEKLLGFEGGDGGKGSGEFKLLGGGNGDGGENRGVEEYYRRMVEENPGNALLLGNYAQFLYQSKGDLEGAEEYYSRAILADPNDGTVLSQYAKLVWESRCDPDRASSYFERAVQASPEDSHVQAAYAHFLWDEDDDDDDDDDDTVAEDLHALPMGFMASATM